MTAFTDDLDNDVEVLAEHHDVTPVQVAKAAFAQVPEHVRLPLLRELLSVLPQPVTEDPEVLSPHTGLPQKLRGAIHELTRRYPVNLIVDAAMLEVDDEIVREAIARAFLPKKPLREKLDEIKAEKEAAKAEMFTAIDVASGEELGLVENVDHRIRVLDGKTGQPISYEHVRIEPEYDFREGEVVKPRKLALYSKVTTE
jgi:hypothetical protein